MLLQLLSLVAAVQIAVEVIPRRDVEQHRQYREHQRWHDLELVGDEQEDEDEAGGQRRLLEGAAPRRRLGRPGLGALGAVLLLSLVGCRGAAGTAADLDRAGGV